MPGHAYELHLGAQKSSEKKNIQGNFKGIIQGKPFFFVLYSNFCALREKKLEYNPRIFPYMVFVCPYMEVICLNTVKRYYYNVISTS